MAKSELKTLKTFLRKKEYRKSFGQKFSDLATDALFARNTRTLIEGRECVKYNLSSF